MPALRPTLSIISLLAAFVVAALVFSGTTSSESESVGAGIPMNTRPSATKETPAAESTLTLAAGSAVSYPDETKHDEIPAVWEDQLFDILELGVEQMSERNARLIELATVSALGEPRVQQECLRHLAFGLPSSDIAQMISLATDARIPEQARAEFVSILLETRPDDVTVALRAVVPAHYEGRWRPSLK